MFRADEHGEILFKRVEIGTRRSNPIGLEGFEDEFNFCGTEVGGGEVESVLIHLLKE